MRTLARLQMAVVALSTVLCSCGISANRSAVREPTDQMADHAGQAESKRPEPGQERAAADPKKFAIIVAGVGGEESYIKKFTGQAFQLYDALTGRLGFDVKNVHLLTEAADSPENSPRPSSVRATAAELRSAFASIKSSASADSLVFIVLIGHGSFDSQEAKFNLVGPDLSAKDYAQLVGGFSTRRIVFVNCASSSGEFMKPLSAENRVIVTATRSGNEQNATIFAEHFIAALTDIAADGDKSGRISVLEAFNYATKLTADWYKQKDRLATEHALIDDNGDGIGHEQATAGDGALAKTTYLDSKTAEQAGADAELLRLFEERQRLEESIEKLKARKSQMKIEEYETELEQLLVELATVNQSIKSRKK